MKKNSIQYVPQSSHMAARQISVRVRIARLSLRNCQASVRLSLPVKEVLCHFCSFFFFLDSIRVRLRVFSHLPNTNVILSMTD
jgi:hypothetical protein